MAAVDIAERPARILVGAFRDAAYVRRTLQTLQSRGIDPDFMGAIIKDDGEHANLLSVRAFQGRQTEGPDPLPQGGATGVGRPGARPNGAPGAGALRVFAAGRSTAVSATCARTCGTATSPVG